MPGATTPYCQVSPGLDNPTGPLKIRVVSLPPRSSLALLQAPQCHVVTTSLTLQILCMLTLGLPQIRLDHLCFYVVPSVLAQYLPSWVHSRVVFTDQIREKVREWIRKGEKGAGLAPWCQVEEGLTAYSIFLSVPMFTTQLTTQR